MKPLRPLPLAAMLACTAAAAPATTDWHGYPRKSFTHDGAAAYVVEPKTAAPGKPWIWRLSWPDYHAEVDLELLRCGYHVAYVEMVDMLGSDRALDLMDGFHAEVRRRCGLAARCALEPNSRGGLHAYRYAVRRPERVACILGDVPVMDFKSWPRKHPGSQANWAQVIQAYGFRDEAEALAYPGNPLDQLEPIARAKIPLRHTICLSDRVVPPEENTLEAKRRLEKLGWGMELAVVQQSDECEGHHFPFPEVFASTRFVMRHTAELPPAAAGAEYFAVRSGLANSRAAFEQAESGRIAFVGGSITANGGWRDELMTYFKGRFPDTKFDFIATGVPSVGSLGHAFRIESDVLAQGPVDLVFVEAAVNDHNYDGRPEAAALALQGMEGVVRQLRAKSPATDVVLMHFIHDLHLPLWQNGATPYPIAAHEKVAAYYGCPSLNLSREVAERIAAGQFTWAGDFRDLHPSPYGQRVYANSMMRMLDAAFANPAPPSPHPLPEPPLDPNSFARGRHGSLAAAALKGGFVLDPKWIPQNGQGTRPGYSNCPALTAAAAGAELTYAFEGTAFGLFLAAGRDTGVIEYSTDGGPFKQLDTWAPWSDSLNLPWPLLLEDDLSPGNHTITVRTTAHAKDRSALHIIHILLN
jgi:hypothetical protein